MADIQQQTDVNQAKARLEEVNRQKEAQEAANGAAPSLPATTANSTEMTPAQKNIRPVNGKPKKTSFGDKLKTAMFGDIGDGSITEHIFFNIFVPSFKRVLSDMANTAINMALGLDPKTRVINASNTHTANASTYRDRNYSRNASNVPGYSRREALSDYTWDEETAKDIYDQMNDLVDRFGKMTMEDAYSIMNLGNKIRSTDRYWGWTSMKNIEVYPTDPSGQNWIVDLPPARPLS